MTLQKSSRENRYVTPRTYFGFLVKQNWPVLITNLIILILLNIIPLYMFVGDGEILELSQVKQYLRMKEFTEAMRAVNTIVGSVMAVVWGCGCMSYLNSKTNIHFYHSIPMTRTKLYVYESLTKFVCYVLPLAISTLLSITILGIRVAWDWWIVGIQLSGFVYSVAYFFLYYCMMVFAASFTGTAFSRILNAGLVVFLPTAILACLAVIFNYRAVYSSYDWMLEVAAKILMPVRTVIVVVGEAANVPLELLLAVGFGLVLWFIGALIYKFRKSELSGTPVISKVAAGVIKYTCMFCASVVGGMFFEAIANGTGWFICGALTGALLSLMLINTILTKSAKQMFRGLPGFGAFCAVFVAVFVLFGMDLVGFDRYVPVPAFVKHVSVSVDDTTVHLEDKEDVKRLTEAVRAYIKANPKRETAPDALFLAEKADISRDYKGSELTYPETLVLEQVDYVTRRQHPVNLRFVTKLGFIYEKTIRIYPAYTGDEGVELLSAIADSEEFAEAYFGGVPSDVSVHVTRDNQVNYEQIRAWNETGYPERLAAMRAEFNGMDYFQRGTFLTMSCRGADDSQWYATYTFPVYEPTESEWREFLNDIEYIYVLNNDTGEMTKFEDKESIRTICESTSFLRWNAGFTLLDPTYSVSLFYKDDVCAERSGAFVRGMVPDFIK